MSKVVKKLIGIITSAMILCLCTGANTWAVDDNDDPAEEILFTSSLFPDVLLVLDLSGSMVWNAAGGTADATHASRLTIAKQAIFSLLDYNGDGMINKTDSDGLDVRFGYMRYYGCDDSNPEKDGTFNYTTGCNKLIFELGSGTDLGKPYSYIYCRSNTQCTVTDNCRSGTICVNRESASGGTPLAAALAEAKMYLDVHKAADTKASDCRKKYVILITDGADTYACNGDGSECQATSYKRRRDVVLKTKALKDAGYSVYVIGLGSAMPDYLKNTLNWMAYFGGTDDPSQNNDDGDHNLGTIALNLSGYSSCQVSTGLTPAECKNGGSPEWPSWKAPSNDPGYLYLNGYAFMAGSTAELSAALKAAVDQIKSANYSFSQASIQATRAADENFLYEGSFEPVDDDPFWKGHLKQFPILFDGTIGQAIWDAGELLKNKVADNRSIYTYTGDTDGALTEFTTGNISYTNLGITTGTDEEKAEKRREIIGYIRGESTYNPEDWKLGDVFRTTPITVGTPSIFFDDARDENQRFKEHREGHERTSSNQKRIVTVGTNAGQFHALYTHNGAEAWSFIPPNLLEKLQLVTHKTHPANQVHHFFIDGPLSGSEVWWGSGDGTEKEADSWKTLLVFGEARGAVNYGWSSSPNCNSGFSNTYDVSGGNQFKYYCGYHALDVTDSPAVPKYLWHLNFLDDTSRAAQAPYLGDPWSKMQLGRVRINVNGVDTEKWVGFMGAGFNEYDCKNPNTICDKRGKGFFVVDLSNGNILWSFNNGTSNTDTTNTEMDYSLAAGPAIIDADNDGFIDVAYVGDLGGNVWRFKFCRKADMPDCGISGKTVNWKANMFFNPSAEVIRPIYTTPSAAMDTYGDIWIYWGTGDKLDPTSPNAQEHFYGVKDLNRDITYTLNDLVNITADQKVYTIGEDKVGYRIVLGGQGEKVLADSTVFGGVVYFTTYKAPDPNNLCAAAGTAYLYGINYTTGQGVYGGDARNRYKYLGVGIASSPIVSIGPNGNDLHVTISGGGGIPGVTKRDEDTPGGRVNQTNILYWKDRRVSP